VLLSTPRARAEAPRRLARASFAGALLVSAFFLVTGCADRNIGAGLSQGTASYNQMPAALAGEPLPEYRIGPLDSLRISVFQEKDLSFDEISVDSAGKLALPLIGAVEAAGRTAPELARTLERLYGDRYLVRPQVAVMVRASVAQNVTVQGEVAEPGVYPIKGPTTLLQAIALAKGETRVASLNQVVVLRQVKGQRMGAVFDVASIRRGEAADPALLGNDQVIVGYANAKGLWRDALAAAPLLNVFSPVDW
jgi:polysaccharide biosynthesis/export protein